MRREIVPPSKLIVTIVFPPKGGFLIRGVLIKGGRLYTAITTAGARDNVSLPTNIAPKDMLALVTGLFEACAAEVFADGTRSPRPKPE